MTLLKKLTSALLFTAAILSSTVSLADKTTTFIPILVYHNLNPTVKGSMNLTPAKVESQIKWIVDNGYTVVPLKQVVEYLNGTRTSLPPKAVVVTADDGWKSDYDYLFPIVKKYKIPVTLFLYPEVVSVGKNFVTWEQVKEMQQTGYFDIQDHTYSHPNFKQSKKHMSPEAYDKFVKNELGKSKQILEEKLGTKVTLLAWPFGIYNDQLEQAAKDAGYTMAFTIDAIPADRNFKPMAQPRYMIVDGLTQKTFTTIIKQANS